MFSNPPLIHPFYLRKTITSLIYLHSTRKTLYFYPSSSLGHKNHLTLFQAFRLLQYALPDHFRLIVTVKSSDFPDFQHCSPNITFLAISRDQRFLLTMDLVTFLFSLHLLNPSECHYMKLQPLIYPFLHLIALLFSIHVRRSPFLIQPPLFP